MTGAEEEHWYCLCHRGERFRPCVPPAWV